MSSNTTDLLARPMYGFGQVDRLLGIRAGTSRRWIDGYRRAGKAYPPVVREEATSDEIVTWGEFVETRLLSEYRDAGVPMINMRPAIQALRKEFGVRYPLATALPWLDVKGRELVLRVQEQVELEHQLALVVLRTGQIIASEPAEAFLRSLEWSEGNGTTRHVERLRPVESIKQVVIDPLRGFGEPVVRGVRTEVIGELFRGGESEAMIADLYDLEPALVEAAVRYELTRAA